MCRSGAGSTTGCFDGSRNRRSESRHDGGWRGYGRYQGVLLMNEIEPRKAAELEER